MAMATSDEFYQWPDWMPLPQISGYGYEPSDRRTRTDMEVGSVLRVNFDSDETTVTCMLICNTWQAAWFEAFERGALRQGSRWFRLPLQTGGAINWHTARLAARPKAQQLMGVFHTAYQLQLELEQRELEMCDDLAEILVCIPPEDLVSAADSGEAFVTRIPRLDVPQFWLHDCAHRRAYEYGL